MAHIPGTDRKERRRFVGHYLEMLAAMIAGMAIGGGLVSLFCSLTGHEDLLEHAGASAPIMATNMVIGMTVWMRLRGHDWQAIAEMAAAMYVPLAMFIIPFWLGVVPGGLMLGGMHLLMLPAMWFVMARRPAAYVHVHRHASGERMAHAH
jgi:flagellar biosynthetic protein FliP